MPEIAKFGNFEGAEQPPKLDQSTLRFNKAKEAREKKPLQIRVRELIARLKRANTKKIEDLISKYLEETNELITQITKDLESAEVYEKIKLNELLQSLTKVASEINEPKELYFSPDDVKKIVKDFILINKSRLQITDAQEKILIESVPLRGLHKTQNKIGSWLHRQDLKEKLGAERFTDELNAFLAKKLYGKK